MHDMENTIRGLEDFIESYKAAFDDDGCAPVEDALSLLKAQRPRIMTLEELYHAEHKGVYLERRNGRLHSTEPAIVIETRRGYFPSIGNSYIFMRENKISDKYFACDYNKKWRCWTSRPTDEQWKAVKWE